MPDISFHVFDIFTRLLEEGVFHETPLYSTLDKMFGIKKIDPFEQLGIYNMIKQSVGAVTTPIPGYVGQMTLPASMPAPPPIAVGGQVVLPSRQKQVKAKTQIFG